MRKRIKAFTILELLVVVAIIGILVVVGLVNYNVSKAKARDSRRFADVDTIATAIMLYKEDTGSISVVTTDASPLGTGYNSLGYGWFNYVGTGAGGGGTYARSISAVLVSRGFLSATVIDPSGCDNISGTSDSCSAYYYQNNGINGAVYAKLERTPTTEMTTNCTNDTNCPALKTSYKINYVVRR